MNINQVSSERDSRYFIFIERYAKHIVALTLLCIVLMATGLSKLGITIDYRVYFTEDNKQLNDLDHLEATYGKDNFLYIAVHNPSGDVFERHVLKAINQITEDGWLMPYALRVDSIVNYHSVSADGDDIYIEDLLAKPSNFSDVELKHIKKRYLEDKQLLNSLLSAEGSVTGINISLNMGHKPLEEVPTFSAFINQYSEKIKQRYPDLEFHISGTVIADKNFADATEKEMKSTFPLSYFVMFILLIFFLRSFFAVASSLLIVSLAVIFSMGFMGWFDIYLNPVASFAPSMIMIVGIADCIHFFSNYFQHRQSGKEHRAAVERALNDNVRPIFFTSIFSAIGFLSLNASISPPFHHLGNMVAIGVITALFLSIVFLPALLCLVEIKKYPSAWLDNRLKRLADFVIEHAAKVVLVFCLFLVYLGLGLPKNHINEVFHEYFDESFEFRRSNDFINKNLRGPHRLDFALPAESINAPEYLQLVDEFSTWFRTQPETSYVASFADDIKRLNQVLHQNNPDFYVIPQNRELNAQLLTLYEMTLPQGIDLSNRINQEKTESRLTAYFWSTSSQTILDLNQRADEWLQVNAPASMRANAASMDLIFAHIAIDNIGPIITGTLLVLLLISVLLILSLQSISLGLLSIIPNLLPAFMAFGLWGYFSGYVNSSLSIVTAMTLGIIVDDTVHFLVKFRFAREELALTVEDSLQYAYQKAGVAISITTVVFVAGFAILSLSHFAPNSMLGAMTAFVICMAWLADMIFLPALMVLLMRNRGGYK